VYYIYHIPNVKIGCSTNPQRRVTRQGYSDYEILEEHTCIDIASDREQQLQKKYGYTVDCVSYSKTHSTLKQRTSALKKIGHYKRMVEASVSKTKKGVVMLDKETKEPIKEFDSVADAARYFDNGYTSHICQVLKGRKKSIYGYSWQYK
jgi:hypothetical protein